MKNAINYYYNLVTYDIRRIGQKYKFTVDDNEYLLCVCEYSKEELEEIYKLSNYLLYIQVFVHQIILNNNNQIITYINNEPYILMRIFVKDRSVSIDDIYQFNGLKLSQPSSLLLKNNWRDYWINKIDYFEYQVRELGSNYAVLKESFDYFVGMTETAISLLYGYSFQNDYVVAHRRVGYGMTLEEFYNPLNLIIDSKVRDVTEFFKSGFFEGKISANDILTYFSINHLTSEDMYLFFVRMLFPSFYFDLYEQIVLESKKETELLLIINKIEKYQEIIRSLYVYLKQYIMLPDIEWIIKT